MSSWLKCSGLLLFLTAAAFGQVVKAKTIRDMCQQALAKDSKHSQCGAYLSGALDANNLWYTTMLKEKHLELLSKFYCAPDNLEPKQAAEVFIAWLDQNATFESQSAANALVFALRDKYPCK